MTGSSNIWDDNPAMKELMLAMDKDGHSRKEIIERLHENFGEILRGVVVTPNSVSGVLHRNRPREKNYQKRVYVRGVKEEEKQVHARVAPLERRPVWVKRSTGETKPGCALMDLNDDTCRWPVGEENALPPYTFCGERPAPGFPYCRDHYRASRRRPEPSPTERVKNSRLRY